MKSIGRKGKTQGLIKRQDPLVVLVSKNGRPTSKGTALSFLKKHFPEKSFLFFRDDHSAWATEVVNNQKPCSNCKGLGTYSVFPKGRAQCNVCSDS